MIFSGLDVIKTDFENPFEKLQGVAELNYFFQQKISANVGYEYWTNADDYFSVGLRYYFFSFVSIKPRLLINDDSLNGSFSLGYKYFLNRRWRWESSIDYYFSDPALAVRTGFSYVFTR